MKIIQHSIECQPKYPCGENFKETNNFINELAPLVQENVKNHPINFWVRGSSGAILGALLASKLTNDCTIYHIKKTGECSHNFNSFNDVYTKDNRLNIIVDDFAQSGETINEIFNEASKYVCSINYLILHHMRGWKLNFTPNNLIIHGKYVFPDWEEKIPSRFDNEKFYLQIPSTIRI